MSENSPESIAFAEVTLPTFAQDCIELTNILGVEQLALDFDFEKPPVELLDELAELVETDIITPEDSPEKNIQRVIANIALLTFYDRIPSTDSEGIKYGDIVDGLAAELEENVSTKMKFYEKLASRASISINEHFDRVPRDLADIAKLKNDSLNKALARLHLGFSKDASSPERFFLRVPPTDGVDQNCIYFTAVTLSTAMRMSIPREDLKMFLAGYHGGALLNNFPYAGYFGIMDPYKPKLAVVESYASVSTDKVFKDTTLDEYSTYGEFFNDSSHNPGGFIKEPLNSFSVSFLAPEDGLLAAEFVLLGHNAYRNGDEALAKHYLNKAIQFDPNNSYAKRFAQ